MLKGLLRPFLFIMSCLLFVMVSRAEYQYRPGSTLNELYDLHLGERQQGAFNTLMEDFSKQIFSNPDAALVTAGNIGRLGASSQLACFTKYLQAKIYSAKSDYDLAYSAVEPLTELKGLSLTFRADILLLLARLQRCKGDFGASLSLFHEVREVYEQQEDYLARAVAEINLAELNRAIGRFEEAWINISRASTLIEEKELPQVFNIYRLDRQAAIEAENFQFEKSEQSTRRLIAVSQEIGNAFLEASGWNQLGALLKFQDKIPESLDAYGQAIALWKTTGHVKYYTNAIMQMAGIYNELEENDKALRLLINQLPLLKEKNWYDQLGAYYGMVHRIYLTQKEFKLACLYGDSANRNLSADIKARNSKELDVQQVRYELELKELALERNRKQRNYAIAGLGMIGLLLAMGGVLVAAVAKKNRKIKHINEALSGTLADRELLLKEIHHRVKNNLQIIASLLYLQSNESDNTKVQKLLEDGQGRVRSMALIHQKLYENETLESIPFDEYLPDLVNEIQKSFGDKASSVTLDIEARDVYFDVDTAVPLGLIINELSTNAFKYAFEKQLGGVFKIVLQRGEDGHYRMVVSDNGVGIPQSQLSESNSSSLGLKLTRMLSEQLEGEYTFSNENGTTFELKFAV